MSDDVYGRTYQRCFDRDFVTGHAARAARQNKCDVFVRMRPGDGPHARVFYYSFDPLPEMASETTVVVIHADGSSEIVVEGAP